MGILAAKDTCQPFSFVRAIFSPMPIFFAVSALYGGVVFSIVPDKLVLHFLEGVLIANRVSNIFLDIYLLALFFLHLFLDFLLLVHQVLEVHVSL